MSDKTKFKKYLTPRNIGIVFTLALSSIAVYFVIKNIYDKKDKPTTGGLTGGITTRATIPWVYEPNILTGAGRLFSSMCYAPEIDTLIVAGNTFFLVKKGTESWKYISVPNSVIFGPENPNRFGISKLCVTWVPAWGKFITGTFGGVILSSTDGITWTAQENPYQGDGGAGNAICWSPEQNTLVVLTGDYNQVFVYRDKWTTVTVAGAHPSSNWNSVCWAKKLGLFVAVGGSIDQTVGTFNKVMVSKDGLSWTVVNTTKGQTSNWKSICWSPELGKLVAVSESGQDTILISKNGYDWETVQLSSTYSKWQSICWCPEAGIFMTVMQNYYMTSTDGKVWSPPQLMNGFWNNVVWIPKSKQFFASASNGTIIHSPVLQS